MLSYVESTGNQASANNEDFLSVIENYNNLSQYNQISSILISSSNYDQLVLYANKSIDLLEKSILADPTNLVLYANLMESICNTQKNLNGRTIKNIPNLRAVLEINKKNDQEFFDLFKFYVISLSNNMQYEALEDVLKP